MISDKNLARIAGFCYLVVIATGLFSEVFVRQALRVGNDALATAHNIQTNEMLFRWGFLADGNYCILIVYVIYRTNVIPKIIGVLYAVAGICYLINSFTMFLSKGFANPLFNYLAVPIFIGELSLCLWLLIKGIDKPKLDYNKLITTIK